MYDTFTITINGQQILFPDLDENTPITFTTIHYDYDQGEMEQKNTHTITLKDIENIILHNGTEKVIARKEEELQEHFKNQYATIIKEYREDAWKKECTIRKLHEEISHLKEAIRLMTAGDEQ